MKVYLVGGAVRDECLSLPVQERDYVVVGATEAQMLALGYRRMDVAFPVFTHPDSGDEYALARRERKTGPGYKGFAVEAGVDVSLDEDLRRRDLTVNALARGEDGEIVDLFGGLEDLEQGLLRHISPAFIDDPVRMLRAARFTALLANCGFRIAHGTFALLKTMAQRAELHTVYPDRLRTEMLKALGAPQPWRFFETLHRCGALRRLLPDLDHAFADAAHGNTESQAVAALKRICAQSQSIHLRYAVLLAATLDCADAAVSFNRQLRMDRAAGEVAVWLLDWPAHTLTEGGPEQCLRLVEELKLLHQPERTETLAAGWAAIDPQRCEAAHKRLEAALAAVGEIRARDLEAEGFKGPELGRMMRERRLQALARCLP